MVQREVRQGFGTFEVVALGQDDVVEVRRLVQEDVGADDIPVPLEHLGLLISGAESESTPIQIQARRRCSSRCASRT